MEFSHFSLASRIDPILLSMKESKITMTLMICSEERNTLREIKKSSKESQNECGLEMSSWNSSLKKYLLWYVSSLKAFTSKTSVGENFENRDQSQGQLKNFDQGQAKACLIKLDPQRKESQDQKLPNLSRLSKSCLESQDGTQQQSREVYLTLLLDDHKTW